jgi:threonine dehydratase
VSAFATLVRRTPLVAAPQALCERAGGIPLLLKLESLQRTGSFKLRGASLRLDALTAEERARGVVTASAGNHGQGLALAGRTLGIPVEVIVPTTVPSVKRSAIAALGAGVTVEGAGYDAAEAAARARAATTGAIFVSPYDDQHVIRGNGWTLGEEIREQAPRVARVILPIGGGGLVGGLAESLAPRGVEIIGVQPEANCAMHESLRDHRAHTVYEGRPTVAEGCEGAVAESTYALCAAHQVRTVLVGEDAILAAVAFAYHTCGLIIEPTAAVALAGVLEGAVPVGPNERPTVLVLTGSNVEPELLDRALRVHPG